jgi:3-oxoacyl-[acyl-carrier-protein] synthase-3
MKNVSITGTGYFVPERIVTNEELVNRMNTSVAFIETRTGVLERRHVDAGTCVSDIAAQAARQAVEQAGIGMGDIDMLIVNTLSPDYHDPSQACDLHRTLGLGNAPAFDIRAQCSGALYGMDIARQYIETGRCKNVLVVCAEILSRRMDVSDEGRNLSILLSDGAGAFVLSETADKSQGELIDVALKADGTEFELLYTKAPGSRRKNFIDAEDIAEGAHFFRMNGKAMFVHAVKSMADIVRDILSRNHLSLEDVSLVVPHQPNLRLLEGVLNELQVSRGKAYITVEHFGNMASASMPVAYAKAVREQRFSKGDLVLFLTYGAGATWGAALYRH